MPDLLEQIEAILQQPQVIEDPYQQYLVCVNLGELLPMVDAGRQRDLLQRVAQLIPRCRRAADPEAAGAMLQRMLALDQEELYDALRVEHQTPEAYQLQSGEDLYPTDGFLGRYLRWARWGNAPLGFHFWSAVAAMGAVAQRRVFYPGARRIFLNSYIVLGGMKSSGKGQALDAATLLLQHVNEVTEGRQLTPQERARRLINTLPPDSTMESLVTQLAARRVGIAERVPQIHQEGEEHLGAPPELMRAGEVPIDATGILLLDEMATFFGKDAWAVARKGPFMTTIKESRRYVKLTKRGGLEELENCAVSMLANCAPDWMQNTIQADLLGGGFMDRCVWVYREPAWSRRESWNIINAPPLDPIEGRFLAEWLSQALLDMPMKVPAALTRGAERVVNSFYKEQLQREHRSYQLYGVDAEEITANRVLWTAVQLAVVLAISRGGFPPLVVTEDDAALAGKLVLIEEESLKTFLGQANRSRSVVWDSRILAWLQGQGGCANLSLLNQHFRRQIGDVTEVQRYVKNLVGQDLAEEVLMHSPRAVRMLRVKNHSCKRCELQ